jgi:L-asparaginase type II
MKRVIFLLSAALFTLGSGVHAQQNAKPRVVILTTGGTIASRPGAETLAGAQLVEAVPQLLDHASDTVEEVARTGSSQMTPELWLEISKRINELFRSDGDLTGVVVTHGTDTMEETAYFLNLTVLDERPVVLVGSMRSANSISADGPSNLLDAVRVAANADARNRGVMIVLNDEINSARAARKTDNQRVQTFRAPELGLLGCADPDTVLFYRSPPHRHTAGSEFELSGAGSLPKVPIVIDYAGFDGSTIIDWIDKGARGIVVQTFAGGRMSAGAFRSVREAGERGVPIVVASRVPGGRIPGGPLVEGSILARDLSAHKARVLLVVALAVGLDHDGLARVFEQY